MYQHFALIRYFVNDTQLYYYKKTLRKSTYNRHLNCLKKLQVIILQHSQLFAARPSLFCRLCWRWIETFRIGWSGWLGKNWRSSELPSNLSRHFWSNNFTRKKQQVLKFRRISTKAENWKRHVLYFYHESALYCSSRKLPYREFKEQNVLH